MKQYRYCWNFSNDHSYVVILSAMLTRPTAFGQRQGQRQTASNEAKNESKVYCEAKPKGEEK